MIMTMIPRGSFIKLFGTIMLLFCACASGRQLLKDPSSGRHLLTSNFSLTPQDVFLFQGDVNNDGLNLPRLSNECISLNSCQRICGWLTVSLNTYMTNVICSRMDGWAGNAILFLSGSCMVEVDVTYGKYTLMTYPLNPSTATHPSSRA